jgi:hypothetical protein
LDPLLEACPEFSWSHSGWAGGFTAMVSVRGWVPSTVFSIDLGQADAMITHAWNARVVGTRNFTIYTMQLEEYSTTSFGFNGAVLGGGNLEGTPTFGCDPAQFVKPYCPHVTWRVLNLWPGGAHVQADLVPWKANGVLRIGLPSGVVVRDVWNAIDYSALDGGDGGATFKLAEYTTTNWGAILDAVIPGGWVRAGEVNASAFCGNLTVVDQASGHEHADHSSARVVEMRLTGDGLLGKNELQLLALDVSEAIGAPRGDVEVLSEAKLSTRRRKSRRALVTVAEGLSVVLSLRSSSLVTELSSQLADSRSSLYVETRVADRLTPSLRVARFGQDGPRWAVVRVNTSDDEVDDEDDDKADENDGPSDDGDRKAVEGSESALSGEATSTAGWVAMGVVLGFLVVLIALCTCRRASQSKFGNAAKRIVTIAQPKPPHPSSQAPPPVDSQITATSAADATTLEKV